MRMSLLTRMMGWAASCGGAVVILTTGADAAGVVTLTVGADWVLLLLPVKRRSKSNQKGAPWAAAMAVTSRPMIFQMRLVSQLLLPGNNVQKLRELSRGSPSPLSIWD